MAQPDGRSGVWRRLATPCVARGAAARSATRFALDLAVNTHARTGQGLCRLHLACEQNPYPGSSFYLLIN
jgi:hypothetical protein